LQYLSTSMTKVKNTWTKKQQLQQLRPRPILHVLCVTFRSVIFNIAPTPILLRI